MLWALFFVGGDLLRVDYLVIQFNTTPTAHDLVSPAFLSFWSVRLRPLSLPTSLELLYFRYRYIQGEWLLSGNHFL